MDITALRSDADTTRCAPPDRSALPPCPFHIEDATQARLDRGLGDRVLACLRHGVGVATAADSRVVPIAVPRLDATGVAELWISDQPVVSGVTDGMRHASNGSVLFGWLHLSESELANMERSVLRAYVRMDQLIKQLGFPHWLRAWNYLAHINAGDGDAERYRRFSVGRHQAVGLRAGFEQALPAATAIGTLGEGLTICFIAGRHPGAQVENPRQVSAFRYPREYGPRSPSFSRAMLHHWRDASILFVSGTASIVGHASLHPGDAQRQLHETLANVEALLAHAARQHLGAATPAGFTPEGFKLYVRSPQILAEVEPLVREKLGARGPVAVLQGDICRTDLALEVEGVYRWRAGSDTAAVVR